MLDEEGQDLLVARDVAVEGALDNAPAVEHDADPLHEDRLRDEMLQELLGGLGAHALALQPEPIRQRVRKAVRITSQCHTPLKLTRHMLGSL